ncbi:TetR/AcrR family transcriptional regulator [Palleronia abyssalis]|uniref:HTH tetR-type domain-containing protein n=1 Tax=Palleronia abyssalis TaxID=1501240 RepID=A0A2R8C259_9RHOB|nr:TetR/AcrR family transcriptional regulator [Palleronia abyssalis]SPJ26483.1 hypothetical protein PAA8504_04345 [Palleronia abyssalis]
MTKDHTSRPTPRVGRPRREDAGAVNDRILASATELFLEKGVTATSCEAVAARARVSKASLYSRYTGKEALFEAVVRRVIDGRTFHWEGAAPPDAALRTRLAVAGKEVLTQALQPVPLQLMRLFLTEARRFPELVEQADSITRARVVEVLSLSVAPVIADSVARRQANEIAERFLDLTFAPIILSALMGRDLELSSDAIDRRIGFALDILEQSHFPTVMLAYL